MERVSYDPLDDDPVKHCSRCGYGIYEGDYVFLLGFENWCEKCIVSIRKML